MNFDKALAFVLSWEGGHSNDPDDAGGETYKGISRNKNPQWAGWAFVDKKDFNGADNLVRSFYAKEYWYGAGCDTMDGISAFIVFDTAVNMGVARAKELLKGTNCWQDYLISRIERYNNIAKLNNNIKFLRGWINRTITLYKVIKKDAA